MKNQLSFFPVLILMVCIKLDAQGIDNYEPVEIIDPQTELVSSKRMSIVGSSLYFTGVILDYSLLPLLLQDPDASYWIIAPKIISNGLKWTGVPFACAGASKANRILYLNARGGKEHSGIWSLYKVGWGFYGSGLAVNIFNNLVTEGEGDGLFYPLFTLSLTCFICGDIIWSITTISSLINVAKARKNIHHKKLVLIPFFDLKGSSGIKLIYNFMRR